MPSLTRRAGLLGAAAALSACAAAETAPQPELTPAATTRQLTAAPGDVMAIVFDPEAFGDAPPPGEVAELFYVGMWSPTEAVFQRRNELTFPGALEDTVLNDVFVPLRPAVVGPGGPFVPREEPGPRVRAQFVLDPTAGGAQFGVDDKAITIVEITPGRVVYRVEQL